MARRRQHGSGSVFYDHTARTWVAMLSMGSRGGKRVRHKARARSEQQARQELERLLRTYRAGGSPTTETVDEYLRRWLSGHAPSVAKATVTSYQGHIDRHISPLLGGILLRRLQANDVRRLITDRLAAGVSPSTIHRIMSTLRNALSQAVADRELPDNPAAGVRLPKVYREPVAALTADHARRIREAVRGDPLEAVYVVLMGTGMRAGEACGLDWKDVDLDAGVAVVRRGKTARSVRTVYLNEPVVRALRVHRIHTKRIGPNEPVFLGPRSGKRLGTPTLSHALPRILERAGLPRMRVHDLRHGYATRAIAKGASIPTVANNLGHSRASITADIYAHAIPDDQRIASDLVGSELA